jgi:hypothetical protein
MPTRPIADYRRYCLLKGRAAKAREHFAMQQLWQVKQRAEPGDSLPADFPFRDRLVAVGYETIQDLNGADASELEDVCFTARESATIFAALAPLIAV